MFSFLKSRLWYRIFLTYMVAIFSMVLVLAIAVNFGIPVAFNRQFMPIMMGSKSMMNNGHMEMVEGWMLEQKQNTQTQLFIGFRRGVLDTLLPAGIFAIGVAFVASLFISRKLVAPVAAMTTASQRIASGNYNERVPIHKSIYGSEQDELGDLAVNFNHMAERLEQTENTRRQLIADVAHELRTPLTVIKGSMEGLIDGLLPAEVETYQQIYSEADRLQRLVRDIEELTRVESGVYHLELRSISVNELVNTAIWQLRRQFEEKGVMVNNKVRMDLPNIFIDEDRIGQVVLNLLGNALQYTPKGGEVVISAEMYMHEIRIAVKDTGIGIPIEHIPHVFDRFYRVDKSRSRAQGGSGIGLTIAKHWIEAHGGKIWVESAGEGKGSTFTFSIPADIS